MHNYMALLVVPKYLSFFNLIGGIRHDIESVTVILVSSTSFVQLGFSMKLTHLSPAQY
jgi:hypothetical protein